jgi:RNA polymerase sigma-70 factor, ECF subfamily
MVLLLLVVKMTEKSGLASAFAEKGGRMVPNSPETEKLLEQAQKGTPRAVDELLHQHREPLRRMINLRLDPALAARVDASDVVQDVLLEASRRLKDYLRAPNMPFHLWLRHLARDHIIDTYRRHRQAKRRTLDREQPLHLGGLDDRSSVELADQLCDRGITPAAAALRAEMKRRLQDAVAALDDDARELILMKHYEQLSNQEIAAFLGISEAASSMRYLRAIRRLKAALDTGSQ